MNLWTENLLFHLEHGMALPRDLQGDPVEFYHGLLKAKKKHNRRKSDSEGDSTPEKSGEGKTLERKSSTKGGNQCNTNLQTITENSKGVLKESPDSKVPKQEENVLSLNNETSFSKTIPSIVANHDCDTNTGNTEGTDTQLNSFESNSSSYAATEGSNSTVQTQNECSNQSADR